MISEVPHDVHTQYGGCIGSPVALLEGFKHHFWAFQTEDDTSHELDHVDQEGRTVPSTTLGP